MGRLNTIGCSLLLLLLSVACSSEQEPRTTVERQEIRFNYFLQEGDQVIPITRPLDGVSRAVTEDSLKSGFQLYGVWNTMDMPTSFTKGSNTATETGLPFFNNRTVSWNSATGAFEYAAPKGYWVADGKTRHSFAARSIDPQVTVGSYVRGGTTRSAFTTARWVPSIDYYVHPDPAQQHDLLVAFGPMNVVVQNATPTVNLYFKHALSKVRFKILSSAGATLYSVKLTIAYVGGLDCHIAQSFTAAEEERWSNKPTNASYTLADGLVVPASASDERSAFLAGEILVQPQKPTTTWLELTIAYSLADTGTNTKSAKIGIPPGVDMKPGMQYTYYIRVADQPEELVITDLQLEPWKTEYKEVDPL